LYFKRTRTGKCREKKSNYPRRERGTEIIYRFALDFWTAAHEARMSGRIPAPSAGYPVDTPPTPDAHVTISNKNSLFFSIYVLHFQVRFMHTRSHTHTQNRYTARSLDRLSTWSYSIHETNKRKTIYNINH